VDKRDSFADKICESSESEMFPLGRNFEYSTPVRGYETRTTPGNKLETETETDSSPNYQVLESKRSIVPHVTKIFLFPLL
jgi:hypothetical protein